MKRKFSPSQQESFARLSGDFNPLHVDPLASRRLMFGACAVHGIHAVLWALDQWLAVQDSPVHLTKLKANFRAPILVDQEVELTLRATGPESIRLEITAGGAMLVQVNASIAAGDISGPAVRHGFPDRQPCRDRSAEELRHALGRLPLCLDLTLAETLFPAALKLLPKQQIATLLALTRLIGMEAPGEHSIFVGIDLECEAASQASDLSYYAESFDDRFSMLELRIEGAGLSGHARAAVRPKPRKQPSYAEVQAFVSPGEFSGHRALVIGGSRGLGELITKLLAAGGAEVRISYHRGADDAHRLVNELNDAAASAASFPFDATTDGSALTQRLGEWSPTILCYFASPFIFGGTAGRFSPDRFSAFCRVYVDGFYQAAESAFAGGALRYILYPSSVAIDEVPLNMAEYAAAKAAGEILCASLKKFHPSLHIGCPRLPRLPTDQTATLLDVPTADPVAIMRQVLRELLTGHRLSGKPHYE